MVLKIKISHEQKKYMKRASLFTKIAPMPRYCLTVIKTLQPATVYPVPLLNWISQGEKNKAKHTQSVPVGLSYTFINLAKLRGHSCAP